LLVNGDRIRPRQGTCKPGCGSVSVGLQGRARDATCGQSSSVRGLMSWWEIRINQSMYSTEHACGWKAGVRPLTKWSAKCSQLISSKTPPSYCKIVSRILCSYLNYRNTRSDIYIWIFTSYRMKPRNNDIDSNGLIARCESYRVQIRSLYVNRSKWALTSTYLEIWHPTTYRATRGMA